MNTDLSSDAPQPCESKLVFDTQKDAWAAATVARFRYGGARLKAYKCVHCQLWHLASRYDD